MGKRREVKNQIEDLTDYINENEQLAKKIEELKHIIKDLAPFPLCWCKIDRTNANYKKLELIGCAPRHSERCKKIRKTMGIDK